MASQDEWANDPYRRTPDAPGPAKAGMGCGMKLLLLLGGLTALSFCVCCGGFFFISSQVKFDFREDAGGALAMQKELLEVEVPPQFQPKAAVTMNLLVAGFQAVMYETAEVAAIEAAAADAPAEMVAEAPEQPAEAETGPVEEVDPADAPQEPADEGVAKPEETPAEEPSTDAPPAGAEPVGPPPSPAAKTARGTLMLAEITLSIPGLPEREFQQQFREGFRQQGKDQPGKELEIIRSETREFSIRGENVPFVFAEAKDAQGILYREVRGDYPGRKGRGFLLLQVPEQEWHAEEIENMLRSIK